MTPPTLESHTAPETPTDRHPPKPRFAAFRSLDRTNTLPLEPVSAEEVRAEAIEHLMRVTDQDDLVFGLLAADPGTLPAARVCGELFTHTAVTTSLVPGCPLLTFATAAPLDIAWRRWCPPRSGSMFEQLLLLRQVYATEPGEACGQFTDPFAEYEAVAHGLFVAS